MKIILTQEVSGLGTPGDIVEVKDGYGRNFLLPRGLAVAWTKGGEKQVASIRKARRSREIASLEEAQQVRAELESKPVRLTARAGSNGRLPPAQPAGGTALAYPGGSTRRASAARAATRPSPTATPVWAAKRARMA